MNSITTFFRFASMLSAAALLGGFSSTKAATDTWVGANGATWSSTTPKPFTTGASVPTNPATGDILLYSGTLGGASSLDDETAGFSLGGITFDATAQAYTLSGNALTLTGGVTNSSANIQTIQNALTIGTANLVFSDASGGSLVLGPISYTAAETTTFQGTGNFTLGGITTTGVANSNVIDTFTNTGNLTLTGTDALKAGSVNGSLILNIGNSGTGTISANIGGGAASGITPATTLNFSSTNVTNLSGNLVTSNDISTAGTLNINLGTVPTFAAPALSGYTGTLTLSGSNDFYGTVTVNDGTLVTASSTAFGVAVLPTVINGTYNGAALVLNGGTVDLDGTKQTVRSLSSIAPTNFTTLAPVGGTITNNGSTAATLVDEEQGNAVFGGSITDGTAQTAVTFDSAVYQNVIYLTGNNTYTGATTIQSMGAVNIGTENIYNYGLNTSAYTYGSLSATTPIIIQGGNYGSTAASGTYPGSLTIALASNYSLPNTISGSGRILFQGTGTTTVSGTDSFNGSVVFQSGTTVLDFSQSTSPTNGTNVLYNGSTFSINQGITTSATAPATGLETVTLGNGYQLSNSAATGYVAIAAGDYLFANGALGIVTSVNTGNNTFTIASGAGARTLETGVIYHATTAASGQVATASVTATGTTVTGLDLTNLQVNENVAVTVNGSTATTFISKIDTATDTVTFNNAFAATGTATLTFDNAIENAVYMGGAVGGGLNSAPTALNPGQANLDIQGGSGGVSSQTIGFLDLSGVSGGTGLGGANGSSGNASNITLIPGTNGNQVVLNIGYMTGGAGGGSSLNFTLPTNADGTLASNALITIADPAFNGASNGNYILPYLNGRQLVTINGNDFAAVNLTTGSVVALSSLSNTVATSASNYFGYAYSAVTAKTYTATPADANNGVVDVLTGGGTAVLTVGGANAYRFNEANVGDTLTFNEANTTTPTLVSVSPLSNILVTSAVGAHATDINGTNLYFSNGINSSNRLTEIFQNNPYGILEIDNHLSATGSAIAKEGQGTLLFTATDSQASTTLMQGTTLVTGNYVAPSFVLATTSATSNVITFTTAGAASTLYVGETLNLATGLYVTSIDTVGNTATVSANYGTTNTTPVSLDFFGGGGLGAPGAGITIDNGATLGLGSGTVALVTTGAVDNTDGSLAPNQTITDNGAVQINWTGSTNPNTNNNTLNNNIGGIGQLVLSTPATGTLTVLMEGNNSYGGGTFINQNTTLKLGQASSVVTAASSFANGATSFTVSSTTGLAVGEVVTGTGIPAGDYIKSIVGNTITLNAAATAAEGAENFTAGAFAVSGTYTAGTNVVTVSDATGMAVGQTVTSLYLGAGGTVEGTATVMAINGNSVTLSAAATTSGSTMTTASNYGQFALAAATGNRDNAYGTTGSGVGFGVTVNAGGTLDLGGYNLNPGSTTVNNYIGGYLTLNGGTVQDGILQLYFGANLYSGTEAANTSIVNAYNAYVQGLTKSTSGTVNMWGLNTYTNGGGIFIDPVTISGGILNFATNGLNWNGGTASGLGAESNAATSLVLDGGTLQYTGKTVVLASDGVTAGSTANPLLNTNGTATAIQATDRLFTITQNGGTIDSSATEAIQFTNTGADVSTGTGNRTLILTGSNVASAATGTSSIASVLSDATTTDKLAVSKTGAGTWSLSGNNTYTGGTTVSNGKLAANNTAGSAFGTGGVTVQSGGTLGGGAGAANVATAPLVAVTSVVPASFKSYTTAKVGIIGGTTEVMSGGILSPGNLSLVGTLTTNALTLDGGSILNFDFNSTTLANSFVAVTASNGFTINGTPGLNAVTLNLFQDGTTNTFNQVGVYNLFSYSGVLGGTGIAGLTANLTPGTYTFVNDAVDHVVQIDITSAPEPQAWAMMAGGLVLLVVIRRFRGRQSQS